MTYLSGGIEYLDDREMAVWNAVRSLNTARRTTNNSQIARMTLISATTVGKIAAELKARGFLADVSKGAAYHWRITTKKPVAWADRAGGT